MKNLCADETKIYIKSPKGETKEMNFDDFWDEIKNKNIKLEDYGVSSVNISEDFVIDKTVDRDEVIFKINKIMLVPKKQAPVTVKINNEDEIIRKYNIL